MCLFFWCRLCRSLLRAEFKCIQELCRSTRSSLSCCPGWFLSFPPPQWPARGYTHTHTHICTVRQTMPPLRFPSGTSHICVDAILRSTAGFHYPHIFVQRAAPWKRSLRVCSCQGVGSTCSTWVLYFLLMARGDSPIFNVPLQRCVEIQRASLSSKQSTFGDLSDEVADTLQLIGSVEMTEGRMKQAYKTMTKVSHVTEPKQQM